MQMADCALQGPINYDSIRGGFEMRKLTFTRPLFLALSLVLGALGLSLLASPASAQVAVGISVHVGRRRCRFTFSLLARLKDISGRRDIGPMAIPVITGCLECGWRRRAWACCGLPDVGAGEPECMSFMPAI